MFDIEPFIQEMLMGLQQAAIEILILGGLFMVLGLIISIIISYQLLVTKVTSL